MLLQTTKKNILIGLFCFLQSTMLSCFLVQNKDRGVFFCINDDLQHLATNIYCVH